jgi:hypothetical protein
MNGNNGRVRRFVVLVFLASFLTGCVSSPLRTGDYTKTDLIDSPALNEVVTKNLGERLITKGTRTTGDAIQVSRTIIFNKKAGESSVLTCGLAVEGGSFFKRGVWVTQKESADCYGPATARVTTSDGTMNWNCTGQVFAVGHICFDKSAKRFFFGDVIPFPLEQGFENIRFVTKVVESELSFVQELLYNGRAGDILKFVYREFSNDLARPAFTQEIQYDVRQSSEIGFREVRLEVLQATNTSITYRVLRTFDSTSALVNSSLSK